MGERDDARREIERKRERMTELAHEVSRRATPRYAKERARDMAREQMMRAKVRAVESTWFGPLLGAGIGALVAKALQARAMDGRSTWRSEWPGAEYAPRSPSSPYRWAGVEEEAAWREGELSERGTFSSGPGAEPHERGGLAGAASGIAEKAGEMKERARAATEHARERLQEASSGVRERVHERSSRVRERIPDREAIRASAHEDTGTWALGALALGALFGFALPVSRREREALEPSRRKARELGHDLEERILAKGGEALDEAKARAEGSRPGGHEEISSPSSAADDASPPLH
jgi:hypothetical protein